jgi:hypothetical protein
MEMQSMHVDASEQNFKCENNVLLFSDIREVNGYAERVTFHLIRKRSIACELI